VQEVVFENDGSGKPTAIRTHGLLYRSKITDISEISHISVRSDKIRYLLNFSYFSYSTQIQPHNNLILIMFYS
jgi:hypothetical protein